MKRIAVWISPESFQDITNLKKEEKIASRSEFIRDCVDIVLKECKKDGKI